MLLIKFSWALTSGVFDVTIGVISSVFIFAAESSRKLKNLLGIFSGFEKNVSGVTTFCSFLSSIVSCSICPGLFKLFMSIALLTTLLILGILFIIGTSSCSILTSLFSIFFISSSSCLTVRRSLIILFNNIFWVSWFDIFNKVLACLSDIFPSKIAFWTDSSNVNKRSLFEIADWDNPIFLANSSWVM